MDQQQRAVLSTRNKYLDFYENAPVGYFLLDHHGLIQEANKTGAEMFKCHPEALKNVAFSSFVHPQYMNIYYLHKKQLNNSNNSKHSELLVQSAEFHQFYVHISSTDFQINDRQALRIILVDKTEQKKLEHQLESKHLKLMELKQQDAVTSIANRTILIHRLKESVEESVANKTNLALFYLDLDGFKLVNDSLGHHFGDEVLKIIAQRLQENIKNTDFAARLGGDEFAIIIRKPSSRGELTRRANHLLKHLSKPIFIEGHQLHISASIGISISPVDATHHHQMIKNADAAMITAKKSGKNHYHFFNKQMHRKSVKKLNLISELHQALAQDEFEIYYQPQMSLHSKKIFALEALLRWRHPKLGLMTPDHFLSTAEECGLIIPITEWVIEQVALQIDLWKKTALQHLRVSVNISPIHCQIPKLPTLLRKLLTKYKINPTQFELEITENILVEEQAIKWLERVRASGTLLSIDDFGTGFSSMSYLKRLPINKIKIDRSFIQDICSDKNNAAIVSAIISMAKQLNLEVIAEGVETQEQANFLSSANCMGIQGHLISPPLCCIDLLQKMPFKFPSIPKPEVKLQRRSKKLTSAQL